VNKKKQKNFDPAGFGKSVAKARSKQKFFGSFFQKRTAFFRFQIKRTAFYYRHVSPDQYGRSGRLPHPA
jgi:hypothetical protein